MLRGWVMLLTSLLGMLTYFLNISEHDEGDTERLTPTIWREFFRLLFTQLRHDCDRMSTYAEEAGVPDFDCPVPAPSWRRSPDPVTMCCRICLERRAVIALRPCGHTLCDQCVQQVLVCPFCRSLVMGMLQLYF